MKRNKDGNPNYDDPRDADNTYTWYDSNPATNGGNAGTPGDGTDTEDFIDDLNDARLGGYSDWRMPTRKELRTIVDYSIPYPELTINTSYFPDTVAGCYWSSTTLASDTHAAWVIAFIFGCDWYFNKNKDDNFEVEGTNMSGYVRAVRGGQSSSGFVDNGNGTVTDTGTGLTWQKATAPGAYTWQQALAYCQGLSLGGRTDWRLPTIKELDSIVDLNIPYPGPTINTSYFPDTIASYYLSSTTIADFTFYIWGIDFLIGGVHDYLCDKRDDDSYYVRAVRGGQSMPLGNSVIAMYPMSGPPGTNFVEWGTGFMPNSTATLHFLKPGGGEYPTLAQPIDANGHFEISYTAPYDKTPGTYTWYAVDGVTGQSSNGVTYQITALSPLDLTIAMSPMSGPPGTTFVEWGTGFTPNSTATLHFLKPGGGQYPTLAQPIDAIGHFEISYAAPYDKTPGTYTWYAVDGVTGKVSNYVDYEVTSLSAALSVTPINPQSKESFYDKFFPSPNPNQIVTGGTESRIIAADGESRLLLRIRASGSCTATIKVEGDVDKSGGLTSLANYRYGDPASTISVPVTQYSEGYFGFALYRVPKDFTIPGYENKLTRPVTLKLTSTRGNADISLTLRRPPIMISHGLWSSAWGNPDMENFRTLLWERFTDRGGKNIMDYIWLNDCLQQNASAFVVGASKTRSNIKDFLNFLRKRKITATQVDYLGHSMGGIWGRMVQQKFSKDVFTYENGYLHKFITLDTPHGGSFIADIGQLVLDYADFAIWPYPNGSDYLCAVSMDYQKPICLGAIEDLTSDGCAENLNNISVPSHAIVGNKPIDTACALLTASTWVSGGSAEPIVKILKVSEWILKKINPDYGCENWFNQFDFSSQTDLVVDIGSQKGGLYGSCLTEFEHKHTASFYADVNQCFFNLLNKGINDDAFAAGFPASSSLLQAKEVFALKPAIRSQALTSQTALGEIQFVAPTEGAIVAPGDAVNVALALTGTLTLNNVLIMAPGSDAVELVSPPYATQFTVPVDAYGDFVISVLGEGTDGNLYAASVTLNVNNTAGLDHVTVAPEALYLDLGQEMAISVTGTYSDGTVRDLSAALNGTVYAGSDDAERRWHGHPSCRGRGICKSNPCRRIASDCSGGDC